MDIELFIPAATTNEIMRWLRCLTHEQGAYAEIPNETYHISYPNDLSVIVTEKMEDLDWTSVWFRSPHAHLTEDLPRSASEYFGRAVYISDQFPSSESWIEVRGETRKQVIQKLK